MKHALVTTTINVPHLLIDYCRDFIEHGHKNDVEIVVVGDFKTPPEAREYCKNLQIKYGIKIYYMGEEEQNIFLPENYKNFLPWNCIQRRNVGILYSYNAGAEIIYTIDDDNFLHTKDYIGSHLIQTNDYQLGYVAGKNGWFNICSYLKEKDGKKFYHRGYSFKHRSDDNEPPATNFCFARSVVSAGLWLGDPDIDAVTRMAIAPEVSGCEIAQHVALGIGTKGPFNSQNTALHRDVIPAYCLAAGLGRYDDIVASYFVKRIADHLGDYISFGLPLVKQERNEHDLFKDFEQEKLGMQLIDDIVDWLYSIELAGTNYAECIKEILDSKNIILNEKLLSGSQPHRDFVFNIHKNYSKWSEALKELKGSST